MFDIQCEVSGNAVFFHSIFLPSFRPSAKGYKSGKREHHTFASTASASPADTVQHKSSSFVCYLWLVICCFSF